jgi:hypothetical protein
VRNSVCCGTVVHRLSYLEFCLKPRLVVSYEGFSRHGKSSGRDAVLDVDRIRRSIENNTDRDSLLKQLRNVKARGHDILTDAVFNRMLDLAAEQGKTPLEQDYYRILEAYEVLESVKRDRNFVAIKTRQMLKNRGIKGSMEAMVISSNQQIGFTSLTDEKRYELTTEYIVMKHGAEFEPEIVESAKQRLIANGCPESDLPNHNIV